MAGEDTAQALLGIWAHSEADCQTKLSGRLDSEDVDRSEKTRYELIGFCRTGMELLYQAHHCEARVVKAEGDGYRWSGQCRVKDYDPQPLSFFIRKSGPNAISFDEKDFDQGNFGIEGSYVRCSLTYKCEQE